MLRIRYEKTNQPNIVVSVRTFRVGQTDYRLQLDLESKSFKLFNSNTLEVVREGNASYLHQLKIKARQALIDFGFRLKVEQRKERFMKIPKEEIVEPDVLNETF